MAAEKQARRALLVLGLVLVVLFLLSFSLGRYGVPPPPGGEDPVRPVFGAVHGP